MSDQKEPLTAPLITLDDVLNTARKDLYMRSRIEELEQMVDAHQGNQRANENRHNKALAIVTLASRAPKKPTIFFSQLVEDYKRERLAGEDWTPKTQKENMAAYKLCMDIIGDLQIHDIGKDRALTYIETLKKLPPNMNKMPAYRGKSISDIIALNPTPISVRTFNKNVERVSSLFKWAAEQPEYDLRYNPFARRSLDDSKAKKRQPFTTDELILLFGAEEFAQRKYVSAFSYWLPLMGLFTGARINELCQLHLSDFVVFGGIHCINIQDEQPGQKLKNNNARRLVPIHDKLMEVGLIRYVEQLRAQGGERLFPTLKLTKNGYGDAPSKWFGRLKDKYGMEKQIKVFHSFRHTFISTMLDDDVEESSIAPIVGHEGKLITGKVYWNAKDAAKRKPTVDRFLLPAEVLNLIPTLEQVKLGKD